MASSEMPRNRSGQTLDDLLDVRFPYPNSTNFQVMPHKAI